VPNNLQTNGRSSTLISVRTFWVVLADATIEFDFAIDPNDYWAHFSKAWVLMAQIGMKRRLSRRSAALLSTPASSNAYDPLCAANNFLGRPDRAIEAADMAIRLSPRDPLIWTKYHVKGWALFMKDQDDHAIEWLRRTAAAAPGAEPFTYLLLSSAYALNGRQAEAQDELKRYLSLSRTKSTTIAQLRRQQLSLTDNPTWVAYNERLFEGLRKAGMPEE
jgi:adenylate cyclase